MTYRSIMGKYYLSPADWREINDKVADIKEYYNEIQEEARRQEELKRLREQEKERERRNNLQRKKAREYLEEIESKLEEEIEEDEEDEQDYDIQASSAKYSTEAPSFSYDGPRYSLAQSEISYVDAFEEEYLSRFQDAFYGSRMTRNIPMDMTFTEQLYHLMRQKGMSNPDVYKAANIDKSLLSRITSDKNYSPSKETAISIALALKLTLDEANDLLKRAGYSISHSIMRDAAIEYCFREKIYNVVEVNILLDKLNCAPLSRIKY